MTSSTKIYTIDSHDMAYIERVWTWAQERSCDMYKTRITKEWISWVIELPTNSPTETAYILQFGERSTNIMGSYYV